jgi:hypothetical protein
MHIWSSRARGIDIYNTFRAVCLTGDDSWRVHTSWGIYCSTHKTVVAGMFSLAQPCRAIRRG